MPEPDVLQKKQRKRSRLPIYATLAVLLLFFVPFSWRYYRVAALQVTVEYCDIRFNDRARPDAMPEILDYNLGKLLDEERLDHQAHDTIYRDRVRAVFCESIEEIDIYDPLSFRGDVGEALLRFKELKRVAVLSAGSLPSEADYKLLCQRLRELPNLEELSLAGKQITDNSLAPLAGHPKLRILDISHSDLLTGEVLQIFKKLPALESLYVSGLDGPYDPAWKSPALHARFRKELPGVTLELPEP